jgi:hypothetical protein
MAESYIVATEKATGKTFEFTTTAWLTIYEPTGLYQYIAPVAPKVAPMQQATATPTKKKCCGRK